MCVCTYTCIYTILSGVNEPVNTGTLLLTSEPPVSFLALSETQIEGEAIQAPHSLLEEGCDRFRPSLWRRSPFLLL